MKNIGKKVTLSLIGIIILLVSVFIFKGFQVTQNEEDYYVLNNGLEVLSEISAIKHIIIFKLYKIAINSYNK